MIKSKGKANSLGLMVIVMEVNLKMTSFQDLVLLNIQMAIFILDTELIIKNIYKADLYGLMVMFMKVNIKKE